MKLFSTRILSIICSVLGVTVVACNGDEPDMYGTPSADYEVKGMVTDTEGAPIEGINVQIGFSSNNLFENPQLSDITTNSEGKFDVEFSAFPAQRLYVNFVDKNGAYESKSDYVDVKFSGKSDGWYKGKAEVEINVKLSKLNK